MKHARIIITSPDRPARFLDITDDGYSIGARWVPLDSSVRDTPPMDTIMTYKYSTASTDLVYATLAALFYSLPVTMHFPIAATDSMPRRSSLPAQCGHGQGNPANCPECNPALEQQRFYRATGPQAVNPAEFYKCSTCIADCASAGKCLDPPRRSFDLIGPADC